MNILVTAGNTQVPVDKVRCITNIFTGRTGAAIAWKAYETEHKVQLLTSHPEVVSKPVGTPLESKRWACIAYRTFDQLQEQLEIRVRFGEFDAVIHCAAVSDYLCAGVYAPAENTRFQSEGVQWETADLGPATMVDRSAGKVKSDEPELWLRLVRAPKLIDRIRSDWGFGGVLVKFKLEVGVSDDRLLEIAERSRQRSGADIMVANTLEGASDWAFLGPRGGEYQRITRRELPERLLEAVEMCQREKTHG